VQMRVEIKKLQRALGVTSIYVTHDQVEAMTLSDKLVVMNGGRIEQIGTPTEVYRRPGTRFVATFIGSPPMNVLPGTVAGEGRVALGGTVLPVADMRAGLPPGSAVEIGIRPEEAEIVTDGRPGSFPLAVDFVEELGATQLLYGQLAGAAFVLQVPTGAVADGVRSLVVHVAPERIHLFDPAGGDRLGREAVLKAEAA
jgi:sn-glycerol 3-phosphate transport system ATP-binding protein